MQKVELIRKLYDFDKAYFSIADLGKILDLDRNSLRVVVSRLTKEGVLERLRRGVYQLSIKPGSLTQTANQLYFPSYLSFEYALAEYGILDQKPYTITFATSKKSRKMVLRQTEIEFRQLKQNLFFGFDKKGGVFWGEPEKVLLDQIYFANLGKSQIDFTRLNLTEISKEKLLDYAKKYSKTVQEQTDKLVSFLGQISVSVK